MGAFFLLRLFFIVSAICLVQSREITHEDIKDAMLSLVHMMRENTEKLERHEARERQLGEQTKKAIALLSKRVSTAESLKLLEERIIGLEQMMIQRDERERIQLEKLSETMKALEQRLSSRIGDVETLAFEMGSGVGKLGAKDNSAEILEKLKDTEKMINSNVAKFEAGFDNVKHVITEHSNNQNSKIHNVLNQVHGIESGLSGIQLSLQKLEEKSGNGGAVQGDAMNFGATLEEQNRALSRVASLLEETSMKVKDLPEAKLVESLLNETQSTLHETKHMLKDLVVQEIHDVKDEMTQSKKETKDLIDGLRTDLSTDVKKVNDEIKDLENGRTVMVTMADDVLDTKRRLEFGVHQILREVGELVRNHGSVINDTLHSKFDGISNDIMDHQNGGMANMTLKMEQEMNQVWRQINAMYKQMMESAKALEKLNEQSEAYVTGTTSTMNGMESKVGEITKRMSEVDENLNYLLGRLSLVTQEFNQIKTGLGAALDNIKASFKEVENKASDLSPGPHPIPEHHKEIDEEEPSSPQPEIVKSNA